MSNLNNSDNEKTQKQQNHETEVHEPKFTPKHCNIYYLDKKLGKMNVSTKSDKIKFSADDNFVKQQNIIDVVKIDFIEPGNIELAVKHLNSVYSLLRLIPTEELAIESVYIDSVYEWNNYLSGLISLLKCSQRELMKQMEYLENFPKNVA